VEFSGQARSRDPGGTLFSIISLGQCGTVARRCSAASGQEEVRRYDAITAVARKDAKYGILLSLDRSQESKQAGLKLHYCRSIMTNTCTGSFGYSALCTTRASD